MKPRKRRIIEPRLQGRLLLLLLLASGTSVVVQTALYAVALTKIAEELPYDGARVLDVLPSVLAGSAFLALIVTVPAFIFIGAAGSLRVFGPLYRFRLFLTAVAAGTHPRPCKIRDDDELQDICTLLNEVTEPLRAQRSAETDAPNESEASKAA